MAVKRNLVCCLLLCLLCVNQIESKRKSGGSGGGGGGGRRTGGGGYSTPRSNQPYPTQGYHYSSNNNNGNQNPYHQSNSYQTGNLNPSAPNPPQSNNGPIGFENVHQRTQGQGSQTSRQDVGFDNVQNRVPQQNAPPPGYQPPPPGYHPPGGVPYQNGYNNQNPHYSQGGGSYPNNYGNNQYGYQNNYHSGSQPGSYYNPQYNVHNGPPPQIYQPIQQSSGGSSFLGYGASFAGGYLIGKLTSGGGGGGGNGGNGNSDDRQYTVHHYHNNRNDVPQKLSVSANSLVPCSLNDTNSLCVPNTFPLCLGNGTIMCVTHLPYTTPCGANSSLACVVTALPCLNNDTSCNNTGNVSTTAVYIPCISNVTVNRRGDSTMVLPPSDFTNNKVKLCVTAIAEPKLTLSRVGSLGVLLGGILAMPLTIGMNETTTQTPSNITTIRPDLYLTTIK